MEEDDLYIEKIILNLAQGKGKLLVGVVTDMLCHSEEKRISARQLVYNLSALIFAKIE